MECAIRKAGPQDEEGVMRLLSQIAGHHHKGRPDMFKSGARKYGHEEFAAILNDLSKPVFVAVDDAGRVLGYVFCEITQDKDHPVLTDKKTLFIDDFCVDETARGQLIGSKLFEAVKTYAQSAGARHINLNVWEFNTGAIRFYEKLGFTTQRRRMEMTL